MDATEAPGSMVKIEEWLKALRDHLDSLDEKLFIDEAEE